MLETLLQPCPLCRSAHTDVIPFLVDISQKWPNTLQDTTFTNNNEKKGHHLAQVSGCSGTLIKEVTGNREGK